MRGELLKFYANGQKKGLNCSLQMSFEVRFHDIYFPGLISTKTRSFFF